MAQNNDSPGKRLKREEKKNLINFSFLNPKNWGVKDYSDAGNFSKAYQSAKKSGEEEFMWNGERYNTKYAGTPRQEVGAYGIAGKPLSKKQVDDVATVSVFPPFSDFLPGHMAASINNNQVSVDYSAFGNRPLGTDQTNYTTGITSPSFYNTYGIDRQKFYEKAGSLPAPMLGENTKSDWNLFTNNCADNVCDALGIERSKVITTPWGSMDKAKEKYPTMDVTGRTRDDYMEMAGRLEKEDPKKVLSQAKNILGIASSPDLQEKNWGEYLPPSRELVKSLQVALSKEGYKLPNSEAPNAYRTGMSFDGIFGPETKAALEDYQKRTQGRPTIVAPVKRP